MEDYGAMRNWFLEPELQKWVWCDEVGEVSSLEGIIKKYGSRVKNLYFSFLEYNRKY